MSANKFTHTFGAYLCLEVGLAVLLGLVGACTYAAAEEPAEGPAYNTTRKRIDQGMIEYLLESGQLDDEGVSIAYRLSPVDSPAANEQPGDVLLRLAIEDKTIYYDKITGLTVELMPEEYDPRRYTAVTIKDIQPTYYRFNLLENSYSYNGGSEIKETYQPFSGYYSPRYPIAGTVFTYSYNSADSYKPTDKNNFTSITGSSPGDDAFLTGETTDSGLQKINITGVFANKNILGGGEYSSAALYITETADSYDISINADFVNNSTDHKGGAIILDSVSKGKGVHISLIKGNFFNNSSYAEGAAIWNWTDSAENIIDRIEGNFVGNHVVSMNRKSNRGGAILNGGSGGKIGIIVADFIGNYVEGSTSYSETQGVIGGAISNGDRGQIGKIVGNFIGNYILRTNQYNSSAEGHGAAIYNHNSAHIGEIVGDFIGNYVGGEQVSGKAWGAAITNQRLSNVDTILGDFIQNTLYANDSSCGGAIYNNRGSHITSIYGNFIQNGAISAWDGHYIPDPPGQGQNGPQEAAGGAIFNSVYDGTNSTIDYIEGSFYENYALATDQSYAFGGAIACIEGSNIGTIKGDFIGNYAKSEGKLEEGNKYDSTSTFARGGAIYADGSCSIDAIYGNFYYNYAYSENERAYGGAIRNASSIKNIINASFIENYAQSAHGKKEDDPMSGAHGGAIFNQSTLGFTADDYKSIFQGNYILNGTNEDDKYYEAIFATKDSKITFTAIHDGHIIFEDIINGDEGHQLILTGDTSSFITFNNHVINGQVTSENLVLNLGVASAPILGHENEPQSYLSPALTRETISNVFRKSSLVMNSGIVSLMDGNFTEYIFEKPITIYGLTEAANGVGTKYGSGESVPVLPGENRASYASFSFDVNLDDLYDRGPIPDDKTGFKEFARAKGDIITVFGTWDEEKQTWSNRSTGRITLSMLTLYAIDSALLFNPYNQIEIIVQLINFVALDKDGNEIKEATGMEWFGDKIDDDFLRVTDHFNRYTDPTAIMLSNAILASDIILETTKTKDDSIRIVSWRDNLAEWAEHEKTADPDDETLEVDGVKAGRKVFTLVADDKHHYLTRDINIPAGEHKGSSALMWGDDLTIAGEYHELLLDLQHKNLLSQIGDEDENSGQKVRLQNFTLTRVGTEGGGENQIYNHASLTLDTLTMLEKEVTIHNEGKEVRVTGRTALDYTITTDAAEAHGQLVFENASNVVEKSVTHILGTVEHQDITHSGEMTEPQDEQPAERSAAPQLTQEQLADERYTNVTHLVATKDGKATEPFSRFVDNALTMEGGKFNLYDLHSEVLNLRHLQMKGGLVYVNSSTVDLAKETMGGIRGTESASYSGGTIWLQGIKIISDSPGLVTHVQFVTDEVGDAVQDNNIRNTRIRGPKYEYLVTYYDTERENDRGEVGRNGWYTFSRTANVNPAVQAPVVAEVTGGFTQMMQVYDYSFEHADLFSATMENTLGPASRDYTVVTPVKGYKEAPVAAAATCPTNGAGLSAGLWVRPYASTEKMNLHNGPTVSSSIYGALVGGDTPLHRYRNGWASVLSVYGAYMGATQKFEDNRTHQNGAAAGLTGTFYRGKFYTALTATAGISNARTNTAYGFEDYDMFIAGVASRSGYSLSLGNCRYVLQPTLLVSYTFISPSDYTSASGMRMETDPLQVLQLHPYLKGIRYTHSGWNPYVSVGYVYNFCGKTHSYADGDKLPELSIDPYVEYSFGVQKTWRSKYTLYGQATGRNGGRNGAEVTTGFRRAW